MKKIILFIALVCLASCTKESMLEEPKTPLEIMVDIASYNQNISDVSTRASVNNGVITSFAPGDDFGLIVVDKNRNLVADNYKYVVQKTGHGYRVDKKTGEL